MERRQKLNVHLYVTPICNLACKHCYYDAWPSSKMPERLLTIDQMVRIIESLCADYDASFDIEGGEFFLRKDINTLFDALPARYLRHITLTTNGTIKIKADPERLRLLEEFRVSVEGHTDALQKDLRGIPLSRVLRICSDLMSKSVPVTLRITLHKKNYEQLHEMIYFFTQRGFTSFSLYEYQSSGRGSDYIDEYQLTDEEFRTVLDKLCLVSLPEEVRTFKLSLPRHRIDVLAQYRERLEPQGFDLVDLTGAASLTIDYNGDLGTCPWGITSQKVCQLTDEQISGDFAKNILRQLGGSLSSHVCEYCSAIRLRKIAS
jgi:MoaA/NifB/PqqE/SkfB family radical SAM enzyme